MSGFCKHRIMDKCKKDGKLCSFSKDCFEPEGARTYTNADRIRAMSDEELAVTMMCPNEMGMADILCDHSDQKNCCKCLLDWLRQPEDATHAES